MRKSPAYGEAVAPGTAHSEASPPCMNMAASASPAVKLPHLSRILSELRPPPKRAGSFLARMEIANAAKELSPAATLVTFANRVAGTEWLVRPPSRDTASRNAPRNRPLGRVLRMPPTKSVESAWSDVAELSAGAPASTPASGSRARRPMSEEGACYGRWLDARRVAGQGNRFGDEGRPSTTPATPRSHVAAAGRCVHGPGGSLWLPSARSAPCNGGGGSIDGTPAGLQRQLQQQQQQPHGYDVDRGVPCDRRARAFPPTCLKPGASTTTQSSTTRLFPDAASHRTRRGGRVPWGAVGATYTSRPGTNASRGANERGSSCGFPGAMPPVFSPTPFKREISGQVYVGNDRGSGGTPIRAGTPLRAGGSPPTEPSGMVSPPLGPSNAGIVGNHVGRAAGMPEDPAAALLASVGGLGLGDAGTAASFDDNSSVEVAQEEREDELSKADGDREHDAGEGTHLDDMPWSNEELMLSFNKFSDSYQQEIHKECLPSLLRYMGVRLGDEDVTALAEEQTPYASLDRMEFLIFMQRCRDLDLQKLREQFEAADTDGSGSLDVPELHTLLKNSGYSPTLEVTTEALLIADVDHSGSIDLSEFEKLRDHLRVTRGILKREAEELLVLYAKVVGSADRLLPTSDISRILVYLGVNVSDTLLNSIIADVDKRSTSLVSFDELLRVIRGLMDAESSHMMCRAMKHSVRRNERPERIQRVAISSIPGEFAPSGSPDDDRPDDVKAMDTIKLTFRRSGNMGRGGKTIHVEDIGAVLADMGYFPSSQVITELLDLDPFLTRPDDYHITTEQMTRFLNEYRRIEGFTAAELQDLREIFDGNAYQPEGGDFDEGSLDALELGRVLRWFGISRTLPEVQQLIETIDFDGGGRLKFVPFTKVMRQLFQAEAMCRRRVFDSLREKDRGLWIGHFDKALQQIMGATPDSELLVKAADAVLTPGVEHVNLEGFEAFFDQYHKLIVNTIRVNAGYTPSEVEVLKEVFDSYDKDGNGVIHTGELRRLIAEHIPEATRSSEGQRAMKELLCEFPSLKAGEGLRFQDFLWLMRRCHDRRDEKDIEREAMAVKECAFMAEEVEGFRQMFSSVVNWAGELSVKELRQLLGRIVRLGDKDEDVLVRMVNEVNSVQRNVLRFPQFLQLMRKIVQENVFGLGDAAGQVAQQGVHGSKVLLPKGR